MRPLDDRRRRGLLVVLVLLATPLPRVAAQLTPPTLHAWRPLGAAAGERLTLEIRGAELEGAGAIRFDDPRVGVDGIEATKDRIKAAVSLPADLPPGPLGFRVVTPRGISEPGRLLVGPSLTALTEVEPNNSFRKPQAIATPAAVEGEIKDGNDVDVFAVDLEPGQTFVAEVVAERAGSGLDALVTIFSEDGRELAANDDLFGHDAACWIVARRRGRYLVQLQDANGRNRDGKVESATERPYRLIVGELPLAVSAFPAGARRGTTTDVSLLGVNLSEDVVPWSIGAQAAIGDVRLPVAGAGALTVRVGDRPEFVESGPEPAADPLRAAVVVVPAAINGRLGDDPGGDVDCFRLVSEEGHEGEYEITTLASRIGSPADPVLSVVDPRGESLATDDNALGRDARLIKRIDGDGVLLAVRDTFGRGGRRFVYRVEVEPAPPRLLVTADLGARTLPRRGSLAVPLTIERRGFDEPVTILAGPLPEGITASPVTIPAKGRGGVLVLSAREEAPVGPWTLRLVARDVAVAVEFATKERWSSRLGPKEATIEGALPTLAIAEPGVLGVSIVPDEVVVMPGGQAAVKLRLDWRGGAGGPGLKVKLLAGDGGLDGFEPVQEQAVPADVGEVTFTLKARSNVTPRRLALSARVWFEGGAELLGVDARPAALVVPEKP